MNWVDGAFFDSPGSIMSRRWAGTGPEFTIEWGGATWALRVDDGTPGLRSGELGPLLALEGLAETGRWTTTALSGSTLARYELRHDRVEATYTPSGWGSVTVRAAWSPSGSDGVDLEVQMSAQSVEELRDVEVKLVSRLDRNASAPGLEPFCWVEPRDRAAAALSYDGREPDTTRLTTLPPRSTECPFTVAAFGGAPASLTTVGFGPLVGAVDPRGSYVEMVHPEDASRRITVSEGTAPGATRYALFGYDLEKGVVLRGRLRGLWLIPSPELRREAAKRYREFLDQPLPLGI